MWIIGAYLSTIRIESTDSTESEALSSGGIAAVFFFYLWTAFYTPSWNVSNYPRYDNKSPLTLSRALRGF